VFGCVFTDSAPVNNVVMEGRTGGKNFGPDGYWLQKFGARLQVHGSEVFIGNNVMPKSRRSFLYRQTVGHNPSQSENPSQWTNIEETVLYDYNYSTAIDVNKELLNPYSGKNAVYFLPGVVVRDNFAYNHGRKGFNLSGKWITIRDNRNERRVLSGTAPPDYGPASGEPHYLTLDGYVQCKPGGSGSISDSLSRAFDLAGGPLWIDSNSYGPARSTVANDGEGILCQAHGGTVVYSWAVTRNSGPEYMAGYDVNHYGSLWAWNNAHGKNIGNVKAGSLYDFAVAGNISGSVIAVGTAMDPDGALTGCPGGDPAAPTGVTAELAGDAVRITYSDNAANEIGFRVERRAGDGPWRAIAYRPRQSYRQGLNPEEWTDYLAPRGIGLRYRVVAVGCADNDAGASAESGEVMIPSLLTQRQQWYLAHGLPADAEDAADPDHDGLSNLLEYALGLHPLAPSAHLQPAAAAVMHNAAPHLELTYRQRAGGAWAQGNAQYTAGGVRYAVQVSPTLAPGSWNSGEELFELVEPPVATGDGLTETVTLRLRSPLGAGEPPAFIRLLVEPLP